MPLDGTNFDLPTTTEPLEALCKRDEVLRVLVEADRVRLSGPEKWWQKGNPKQHSGYCAITAVNVSDEHPVWDVLLPLIGKRRILEIADWNDAPERTFSDVKALFARAISERAKQVRAG